MSRKTAIFFAAAALVAGSAALAQEKPPFERIPLQTLEWPPGYNSTSVLVKFQPNAVIPRHTHPGVESGYLQAGEVLLKVEGKPDATTVAGGSWMIPAETKHIAVAGAAGATAIVTYVVDKAKPLSSPAP